MKDTFGIIPPEIRARYEREEWVEKATTAGRVLERELKAIYGDHMQVILIKPSIPADELPESAVAGRWHVRVNHPPPGKPDYFPILAPGGGYRDPDAGVIAELAEMDLRRPEVKQRLMERTRADSPHEQRARELNAEQRRDELDHNFKAAKRVRGETGLKKSFAAKRGAKA